MTSRLRYVDLLTAGLWALDRAEDRILRQLSDQHHGRQVIDLAAHAAEESLRLLSASSLGGMGELVFSPPAMRGAA